GRSFANGKQMFLVANCIACHKVNGVGTEIGPDLTKLDEKLKPAEILRDIIEPSWRINEKYQTFVFELKSGKAVTGLIEHERLVLLVDPPGRLDDVAEDFRRLELLVQLRQVRADLRADAVDLVAGDAVGRQEHLLAVGERPALGQLAHGRLQLGERPLLPRPV